MSELDDDLEEAGKRIYDTTPGLSKDKDPLVRAKWISNFQHQRNHLENLKCEYEKYIQGTKPAEDKAYEENAALSVALEELKGELKREEFTVFDPFTQSQFCLRCDSSERNGHRDGCKKQKALSASPSAMLAEYRRGVEAEVWLEAAERVFENCDGPDSVQVGGMVSGCRGGHFCQEKAVALAKPTPTKSSGEGGGG